MEVPVSGTPTRLLYVCTGNICRSPMAEALTRWYAARRERAVEVRSAGTLGLEGHPADPHAIQVCAELGVPLDDHRSQGLSAELVAWADHILVMELAHAHTIRDRYPEADGRILMLGTFGGLLEVADPIGTGRYRFRRTRDEIRRCVEGFIDRLPPRPDPHR